MSESMKYRGYHGSVDVSIEDGVLHGKILFIDDLVTYEADTVPALQTEFRAAVDDYIQTCEELGRAPQKAYSGSFNVRVGPELHQESVIYAKKQGITLNELVKRSLTGTVRTQDSQAPGNTRIYLVRGSGHSGTEPLTVLEKTIEIDITEPKKEWPTKTSVQTQH